jgi:hypothetical protein
MTGLSSDQLAATADGMSRWLDCLAIAGNDVERPMQRKKRGACDTAFR